MKGKRRELNKKGQITIFIIIAVVIIALAILLYFLIPRLRTTTTTETKNPAAYIQECLEEKIENTVEILSLQGGSVNPEHYYEYYSNTDNKRYNVEYLCYTNQYYEKCVVQQPMLVQHIQKEILKEIKDDTIFCFNSMKEDYEKKGYVVNMKTGNTTVELLPNKIVTTFGYEVVLEKGETEKYQNFQIILNNDLYKLSSIANSIINWETQQGDVETTVYMNYYHDLKVEKQKQLDGTKIYILTDRNNNKKFQFASRSWVLPPGY